MRFSLVALVVFLTLSLAVVAAPELSCPGASAVSVCLGIVLLLDQWESICDARDGERGITCDVIESKRLYSLGILVCVNSTLGVSRNADRVRRFIDTSLLSRNECIHSLQFLS
jgi:hypothetical protein